MGSKITIDSATLMNKGLEVIEARWLFDLKAGEVSVVIHPQSVIHSMVEMIDGSVIAEMAIPDMAIPVAYALAYPERLPMTHLKPLSLAENSRLTFEEPDLRRFPCLRLAYDALAAGNTMTACLNAANEELVAGFLAGRVRFHGHPASYRDGDESASQFGGANDRRFARDRRMGASRGARTYRSATGRSLRRWQPRGPTSRAG